MITKKIIEDGIYGVAIGDALGVPYEFKAREKVLANLCTDMIGYGSFDKQAGTFSDDTSMTLAGLCGLANMKQESEYATVCDQFVEWLNNAKFTTDGVFDVGRTCMDAIFKYSRGVAPTECGGRGEFHNGNGSLMRIMPAVLYSLAKHKAIKDDFIDDFSSLTHGHDIAKTACKIYANVAKAIIDGDSNEVMRAITETYNQKVFDRLKSPNFYKLHEDEIQSSGYVVDTLEAALWCLLNTSNYKDCVLKAVNLGGDTDTIAAVAGGLAGLYYGKDSIPTKWLETLRCKEMIDELIEQFYNKIK